jgi:Ca2+-transporting ATPase
LDSRINIFKGVFANKFLLLIFFIMVAGQILIVEFGGAAFQVQSLDIVSWLICVGLGFLSIPVGVVIRLIPEMRMLTTSSDAEIDPEKGSIDAITQVQSQLKIYKTLRGGRIRAHFGDKKEKSEKRSKAIEAATILPSLISASVGVQMTTRENQEKRRNLRTNSTSLSENQNASEKNQNSSEPKSEKNEDASGNQDGANEDAIEIQKDS